jgi:hypothetical protein
MMSIYYVYLLLLDRAGQVGGSVEYSEGKDGESVVHILRFLCGSPCPCRLRTVPFFATMVSLELCTDHISDFMGPDKPSRPITTLPNRTPCLMDVVRGGNEAKSQDFTRGQGTDFDEVGTSQMVVIRDSLQESSVWRVGQVLPLQGVYRFE